MPLTTRSSTSVQRQPVEAAGDDAEAGTEARVQLGRPEAVGRRHAVEREGAAEVDLVAQQRRRRAAPRRASRRGPPPADPRTWRSPSSAGRGRWRSVTSSTGRSATTPSGSTMPCTDVAMPSRNGMTRTASHCGANAAVTRAGLGVVGDPPRACAAAVVAVAGVGGPHGARDRGRALATPGLPRPTGTTTEVPASRRPGRAARRRSVLSSSATHSGRRWATSGRPTSVGVSARKMPNTTAVRSGSNASTAATIVDGGVGERRSMPARSRAIVPSWSSPARRRPRSVASGCGPAPRPLGGDDQHVRRRRARAPRRRSASTRAAGPPATITRRPLTSAPSGRRHHVHRPRLRKRIARRDSLEISGRASGSTRRQNRYDAAWRRSRRWARRIESVGLQAGRGRRPPRRRRR